MSPETSTKNEEKNAPPWFLNPKASTADHSVLCGWCYFCFTSRKTQEKCTGLKWCCKSESKGLVTWVKVLAIIPKDLSSISGIHIVDRRKELTPWMIPAPLLRHTYPPPLAPLVPRCILGSLEASLINSFHSFCHSSSVYTSPDYKRDRQ